MSNDSNSRDEWDAMWEVTRRPVPTPAERVEHTAIRDAVAAALAAVVAWIRAEAYLTLYEATPSDVADAIERGEHRREEAK
jgi:hypothetical protein